MLIDSLHLYFPNRILMGKQYNNIIFLIVLLFADNKVLILWFQRNNWFCTFLALVAQVSLSQPATCTFSKIQFDTLILICNCRYSTFLILYPSGISSEVGLTYIALPYIKVLVNSWILNLISSITTSFLYTWCSCFILWCW